MIRSLLHRITDQLPAREIKDGDQPRATARPAPDIRPAVVRMLANNLRNNAYDVAARTMEDLLARVELLEAAQQPAASAEPVAQIYRKGFQHGSIVWTAAGLAADLPDGTSLYAAPVAAQAQAAAGDAERVRNAAEILDTLTSNLVAGHPLRVKAAEGAKRAVADLYGVADQIDAAMRRTSGREGKQ